MAILALALPGFVSMLLIVTALKWFDARGSVSDYEGGCDLNSLVNLCIHLAIYSPSQFSSYVVFPASHRSQESNQIPSPSCDAHPWYQHILQLFLYAFYYHFTCLT